jgi:hypothetical protein
MTDYGRLLTRTVCGDHVMQVIDVALDGQGLVFPPALKRLDDAE